MNLRNSHLNSSSVPSQSLLKSKSFTINPTTRKKYNMAAVANCTPDFIARNKIAAIDKTKALINILKLQMQKTPAVDMKKRISERILSLEMQALETTNFPTLCSKKLRKRRKLMHLKRSKQLNSMALNAAVDHLLIYRPQTNHLNEPSDQL